MWPGPACSARRARPRPTDGSSRLRWVIRMCAGCVPGAGCCAGATTPTARPRSRSVSSARRRRSGSTRSSRESITPARSPNRPRPPRRLWCAGAKTRTRSCPWRCPSRCVMWPREARTHVFWARTGWCAAMAATPTAGPTRRRGSTPRCGREQTTPAPYQPAEAPACRVGEITPTARPPRRWRATTCM